jgi:hypothetical protein
VVDEIASFMRAYENTVVDIEGNTDSTGSHELNMGLSKERAETVKRYLVEKGYPAARMRTAGHGPDNPIDSNSTPEGREKNRRTDIKVYPNPGASELWSVEIRRETTRNVRLGLAFWPGTGDRDLVRAHLLADIATVFATGPRRRGAAFIGL